MPEASITAPVSIAVTRPIGTKIRRRATTSTTRPSTRGAARADPQRDDDVADLADPVAVGVEDGQPGEPGDVRPGHRRHGAETTVGAVAAPGLLDYEVVDVFAPRAFAGNPLAVVLRRRRR